MTIDERPCCIEVIDIPGQDSNDEVLRSHVPMLDGIIFTYSLDSTSSLLTLEKKFARVLPGLTGGPTGRRINDISEFPL